MPHPELLVSCYVPPGHKRSRGGAAEECCQAPANGTPLTGRSTADTGGGQADHEPGRLGEVERLLIVRAVT